MKKVLHVITRLDTGGSAENVLLSAKLADRQRYCLIIASGPGSHTTTPDESGNYIHDSIRVIPHLVREMRPFHDVLAFFEITRLIKEIKPAIVHTHSSKGGILGRWAAWLCRVPVIVHTPHGHVFYGYFRLVKTKMFVWLERLTAKITHRLVALTNGELQESLAFGIGKPEQWCVIHSGVVLETVVAQFTGGEAQEAKHSRPLGLSSFRIERRSDETTAPDGFGKLTTGKSGNYGRKIRRDLRITDETIVVGTVARLEPVKGVDVFIKAAKKIIQSAGSDERIHFVIVGDGQLRSELERTAQTLGIKDKIIFSGERTDILELLEVMDIYVQPSLNEGMGKVLVMAQAAGVPVIASRVSGIPDVVKDGQTGLLVPPGDSESLSGALKKLLNDENLRLRLGKEGQVWVNEKVDGHARFSVERMVYLLEKLYEEV